MDDPTEDSMFAIQWLARRIAHKELWAISVGSGVCHAHQARKRVLDPNTFVLKLTPVDRLVTCAIFVDDIAALHHEARNYSLDLSWFVCQVLASLSGAKSAEVLNSFRTVFIEKFNHYFGLEETRLALGPTLDF